MKKQKVTKVIISAVSLLLAGTILTGFAFAADNHAIEKSIAEKQIYELKAGDLTTAQLETAILNSEDVPDCVDISQAENTHVNRLYEQETDNNTVIFQNQDGTKTMYLYNEPVKFVDENGETKDKSNSIVDNTSSNASVRTTNSNNKYKYKNGANDIQVYFSDEISENSGTLLKHNDLEVKIVPKASKLAEKFIDKKVEEQLEDIAKTSKQAIKKEEKQLKEKLNNKTNIKPAKVSKKSYSLNEKAVEAVGYNEVFGAKTSLRYTPLLNGVKEDIIISEYTGQNTFYMNIETNGLKVVLNDKNQYILADPVTNEEKCLIGDIYIHDSASQPLSTYGTINVKTLEENNLYELEIIAPEEFLTKEEITYPVIIDPTLTIKNYNPNTAIIDAPIYSGIDSNGNTLYPWTRNSNFRGIGFYSYVGMTTEASMGSNSPYGLGYLLIKLPGLYENPLLRKFKGNINNINSCKLYLASTTPYSNIKYSEITDRFWDENTVSYNDMYPSNSLPVNKSLQYSQGKLTPENGVVDFDITALTKYYVHNTYNAQRGIIIENLNKTQEVNCTQIANTYCPVNPPYIVLSYTEPSTFRELNIAFEKQIKNQWCWAASCMMIANYVNNNYNMTQKKMVIHQYGRDDINLAINKDEIQRELNFALNGRDSDYSPFKTYSVKMGYNIQSITQSDITNSIDKGYPVYISKKNQYGGEHDMVLYGYRLDSSWNPIFKIYDPYQYTAFGKTLPDRNTFENTFSQLKYDENDIYYQELVAIALPIYYNS